MRDLPRLAGAHQNYDGAPLLIGHGFDTPGQDNNGTIPLEIGDFARPETTQTAGYIGSSALDIDYDKITVPEQTSIALIESAVEDNTERNDSEQKIHVALPEDTAGYVDHDQEWELVEQIKNADEQVAGAALMKLVELHRPILKARLNHHNVDFHAQEDILSEMTIRAWKALRAGTGLDEKRHLESTINWFVVIADRLRIDDVRKANARPRTSPFTPENEANGHIDFDSTAALDDALERVTLEALFEKFKGDPDHLDTFKLYYLKGYTQREVAEIMEIPEGTVKSRIHYVLKNLKGIAKQENRHA